MTNPITRLLRWCRSALSRRDPRAPGRTDCLHIPCPSCEAMAGARATLERRASQLAVQERRLRRITAAARSCAVVWDVPSGRIRWESGFSTAIGQARLEWLRPLSDWASILGANDAERLREQALSACDNNGFFEARLNLLGHEGRWHVHVHATCEPEVAGQPRTASGLVAIVPAVDALAREADPSPAGDGT